jgi:hypothetical protein
MITTMPDERIARIVKVRSDAAKCVGITRPPELSRLNANLPFRHSRLELF